MIQNLVCVLGVSADSFSKKEIQEVFNGKYNTENFEPEFHSIFHEEGYIVFEILDKDDGRNISLNELIEMKSKFLPLNEERKQIYSTFLNTVGKIELLDKIDIFIYAADDNANEDFYDKLLNNRYSK